MNATDEIVPSTADPTPSTPRVPPPSGYAPPPGRDPREKSVPLACVLSLLPGLGQVYVGYYQRGFVHALIAGSLIAVMAEGNLVGLMPLFGMFLPFFWLYNVIDAGRRAALYNQALVGTESVELPRDFELGSRGSIAGGLILIAGGAILLSHTRFGYSLAWVEDWWPAAPILVGIWLVAKAVQDRVSR